MTGAIIEAQLQRGLGDASEQDRIAWVLDVLQHGKYFTPDMRSRILQRVCNTFRLPVFVHVYVCACHV